MQKGEKSEKEKNVKTIEIKNEEAKKKTIYFIVDQA
jgi:hypothetical protein